MTADGHSVHLGGANGAFEERSLLPATPAVEAIYYRCVSRWSLACTRSRLTIAYCGHPTAKVLQCIVKLELRFVAQKALGPSEIGATVTVR